MKYNAKISIMSVFKEFPNQALTSEEFYEKARLMRICEPPAFNTHHSQLWKKGKLVKVDRSVYKYDTGEDWDIQLLKQASLL